MWGDLDSLGLVFYPRYYEWADTCTHLFFESIDLRFDELWEKRKRVFGLIETSSRFVSPGRYHDVIEIITEIEQLTSKIVEFKHTFRRAPTAAVMLTVREKRVCMDVSDPENIRAVDIPSDMHAILRRPVLPGDLIMAKEPPARVGSKIALISRSAVFEGLSEQALKDFAELAASAHYARMNRKIEAIANQGKYSAVRISCCQA